MRKFPESYELKAKGVCPVRIYRVDMENGTGWQVQLVFYFDGSIGVSIDRFSHYIFRNGWESLKHVSYVQNKLCLPETDAEGMVRFFAKVYQDEFYTPPKEDV